MDEKTNQDEIGNIVTWGIDEGEDGEKAFKIVLEANVYLFDLPPKISLWDFGEDTVSTELKKIFEENHVSLDGQMDISNAFEENYVLVCGDVSYYIQDKTKVYRQEQYPVYLTDYEPILSIHKCIEDYILVTRGEDKRSIADSVAGIGDDIEHYGEKLIEAQSNEVTMEETVLNLCTDELRMTRNQSLKVLALVMASLMERDTELEKSREHFNYIR